MVLILSFSFFASSFGGWSRSTRFPGGSVAKNPPTKQEARIQSLGWEDPLEEEMATHSSTLALGNPTDRGAWWATVHGVTKSQI